MRPHSSVNAAATASWASALSPPRTVAPQSSRCVPRDACRRPRSPRRGRRTRGCRSRTISSLVSANGPSASTTSPLRTRTVVAVLISSSRLPCRRTPRPSISSTHAIASLRHVLGRLGRHQRLVHADKHEVFHRRASGDRVPPCGGTPCLYHPYDERAGPRWTPEAAIAPAPLSRRPCGIGKWQTAAARLNAGASGSVTTRNSPPGPEPARRAGPPATAVSRSDPAKLGTPWVRMQRGHPEHGAPRRSQTPWRPGPPPAGSRLAHALCADRNAGALASSPLGIAEPARRPQGPEARDAVRARMQRAIFSAGSAWPRPAWAALEPPHPPSASSRRDGARVVERRPSPPQV